MDEKRGALFIRPTGGGRLVEHSATPTDQGGVAEWSKAAVLKTVVRLRVPWVRIPPPPQRQPSRYMTHVPNKL